MALVLGKDEQIVENVSFTTNLILAWLKTDFSLTTKRIAGYESNTIFGLIPMGKKEVTFPLKNVSSVGVSTRLHLKRLFFGGILFLMGLSMLGSSVFGGLILAFIGLIPLLNSYTASFTYTNNAGHTSHVQMSILEKDKVKKFVNMVNTSIVDVA